MSSSPVKQPEKAKKKKPKNYASVLFHGVSSCDLEAASAALDSGAVDVNASFAAVSGSAKTPLTLACSKGFSDVVRLLLTHGADPDKVDDDGLAPLFLAVKQSSVACCAELLSYGADPLKAMPQATNGPCASLIKEVTFPRFGKVTCCCDVVFVFRRHAWARN